MRPPSPSFRHGSARDALRLNAAGWMADRRLALDRAIKAARVGPLGGGAIEGGRLPADRVEARNRPGADDLVLDLRRRMPEVRITDLLLDVDEATGFADAFTDLRTGSMCRDRIGVLSVVLVGGLNLGLKKMAASATTLAHWQLQRIARWHVEDDAHARAPGSARPKPARPWRAFGARGRPPRRTGSSSPPASRAKRRT